MASSETKAILKGVGQEIKNNPPKVLQSTERKFGVARAKKQKTAILLSKARRLGGY